MVLGQEIFFVSCREVTEKDSKMRLNLEINATLSCKETGHIHQSCVQDIGLGGMLVKMNPNSSAVRIGSNFHFKFNKDKMDTISGDSVVKWTGSSRSTDLRVGMEFINVDKNKVISLITQSCDQNF